MSQGHGRLREPVREELIGLLRRVDLHLKSYRVEERRTGCVFVVHSAKCTCGACSKIKNFKMAAGKHEAKSRTLLSTAPRASTQSAQAWSGPGEESPKGRRCGGWECGVHTPASGSTLFFPLRPCFLSLPSGKTEEKTTEVNEGLTPWEGPFCGLGICVQGIWGSRWLWKCSKNSVKIGKLWKKKWKITHCKPARCWTGSSVSSLKQPCGGGFYRPTLRGSGEAPRLRRCGELRAGLGLEPGPVWTLILGR